MFSALKSSSNDPKPSYENKRPQFQPRELVSSFRRRCQFFPRRCPSINYQVSTFASSPTENKRSSDVTASAISKKQGLCNFKAIFSKKSSWRCKWRFYKYRRANNVIFSPSNNTLKHLANRAISKDCRPKGIDSSSCGEFAARWRE